MSNNNFHKTWVSPGLAIGFLVISVTGILMFFHIENGLIMNLHEWMGLLFVGVGIFHLVINWKAFLSCFKNRPAIISLCAVSIISLLIGISSENRDQLGHEKRSHSSHKAYYKKN